ncbi:peptide ABC transporter substrate-binding protein [Parasphingorhabdus cellanae]|uniref:Peptide ABC transporter substrate-binding protein n=1 Tax=Parasphingorhabdus cellanae TaxID=2806553 RepID=A0ABX7T682_9SPHN|nr:peptide ABC transporter substrate-binding protein [Parasphingorhabdus cellanae]QTD57114.1 peptide ABC transporter substrate-binding protein [Parasphingorhabdus cellanae]
MRIITLLGFVLLLVGCGSDADTDSMPGPDQIVRLSDSEIKGLDPQKISDLSSLRVAADQFEGLTRLDAAGNAEPGLAGDWSVSDDGLQWTFRLRDGLEFSDGTAFDATLFPQIWTRLLASETASPTKALFENIASVSAKDQAFVVVTLRAPAPSLTILLAHPAMAALPLHRIDEAGDKWTSERPMTVSGPYQLATWQLNDHARMTRNPEWHDEPAPTATIIWKPMDDSLSAMRLFLSGGADIAADYPASRHKWLVENHPDLAHSVPYLGSYYFAFNTRKAPFDDSRVRTALSMAVERKWIAEKVIGIGNVPAWNLLPPELTGGISAKPIWADWDRERRLVAARQLLAEAGYGPAKALTFEIRFNSSAEHRRVSVALAAMWKDLNVQASLFNSEAALHFAALRQHDFALARSGWIADLPIPENFLTVHQMANGSGNYSGYDSAAYDAVVAQAMITVDPDKRNSLMRLADQTLVNDMPILPLYFYVTRSLVSKRIEGWQDNISNVHPSRTLRISRK